MTPSRVQPCSKFLPHHSVSLQSDWGKKRGPANWTSTLGRGTCARHRFLGRELSRQFWAQSKNKFGIPPALPVEDLPTFSATVFIKAHHCQLPALMLISYNSSAQPPSWMTTHCRPSISTGRLLIPQAQMCHATVTGTHLIWFCDKMDMR